MTLREFVRKHKEDIDSVIKSNGGKYFNYEERRLWVLNDESLYNIARKNRVRI